MDYIQTLVLAIIQGLTEFLPVSSSGHLVLMEHVLGIHESGLFLNISLHFGTLLAVIIVYVSPVKAMILSVIHVFRDICITPSKVFNRHYWHRDPNLWMAVLIVLGSIPTAIIGILFLKFAEEYLSSMLVSGVMLWVTGLLLLATRWIKPTNPNQELSLFQALCIGIMQGIAVLPGLSRSGSTISIGLYLGVHRNTAGMFSFLLSMPAILGAELLNLKDGLTGTEQINIGAILFGIVVSFIIGYLALQILIKLINKGKLYMVAPYCWLIGTIAVLHSF